MIFLPLAPTFVQDAVPPLKPKSGETMVILEDWSITIPPLPLGDSQGRAQFKDVHAQIGKAMDDLTASLRLIYGTPEAGMSLPEKLTLPPDLAAQGTGLVGIIVDAELVRLERAFLDTWKGWQAALAEGGLAKPLPTSPATKEPKSIQYEAARLKGRKVLKIRARQFVPSQRLDAGYLDPKEIWGLPADKVFEAPKGPEEREIASDNDLPRDHAVQTRIWLDRELLPDLSEAWKPLVAQLNHDALCVLNWEQTPPPQGNTTMKLLRTHARIAVLERFRRTLWYCDLVWSQVASGNPYPPPSRLARIGTVPSGSPSP